MKSFLFKGILTSNGWKNNTEIKVDDSGLITSIDHDSQSKTSEYVDGFAIHIFPQVFECAIGEK